METAPDPERELLFQLPNGGVLKRTDRDLNALLLSRACTHRLAVMGYSPGPGVTSRDAGPVLPILRPAVEENGA